MNFSPPKRKLSGPSTTGVNNSVISFAPKRQCVRYSASLPLAHSDNFTYHNGNSSMDHQLISPSGSHQFAIPTVPATIMQQSSMMEMLRKYVDRSINRLSGDPKVEKSLLTESPMMSTITAGSIEIKCVWANLDSTQVPCVSRCGTLYIPVSVAELLVLARFYLSFPPRQVKSKLTNVELMNNCEAHAFNVLNSSENYLLGFKIFSKSEPMWPLADIRQVYWDLKLIYLQVQIQQYNSITYSPTNSADITAGVGATKNSEFLQQRLMGQISSLQQKQQFHL